MGHSFYYQYHSVDRRYLYGYHAGDPIFTPIFLPIAQHLGIDPIHFGIIMVFNLTIGLCTPPVGTILFVGCSIGKVSIDRAIKPLLPMFLALFVVMAIICYFPQLSLMLPGLFST